MHIICENCQLDCKDQMEKFVTTTKKKMTITKCDDYKKITSKWLQEQELKKEAEIKKENFRKTLDKERNK